MKVHFALMCGPYKPWRSLHISLTSHELGVSMARPADADAGGGEGSMIAAPRGQWMEGVDESTRSSGGSMRSRRGSRRGYNGFSGPAAAARPAELVLPGQPDLER